MVIEWVCKKCGLVDKYDTEHRCANGCGKVVAQKKGKKS